MRVKLVDLTTLDLKKQKPGKLAIIRDNIITTLRRGALSKSDRQKLMDLITVIDTINLERLDEVKREAEPEGKKRWLRRRSK